MQSKKSTWYTSCGRNAPNIVSYKHHVHCRKHITVLLLLWQGSSLPFDTRSLSLLEVISSLVIHHQLVFVEFMKCFIQMLLVCFLQFGENNNVIKECAHKISKRKKLSCLSFFKCHWTINQRCNHKIIQSKKNYFVNIFL